MVLYGSFCTVCANPLSSLWFNNTRQTYQIRQLYTLCSVHKIHMLFCLSTSCLIEIAFSSEVALNVLYRAVKLSICSKSILDFGVVDNRWRWFSPICLVGVERFHEIIALTRFINSEIISSVLCVTQIVWISRHREAADSAKQRVIFT